MNFENKCKELNSHFKKVCYRENIKYSDHVFPRVLSSIRYIFTQKNGDTKKALFFYVIAPLIPENKFYYFHNFLTESYEEYLKRRKHNKGISNIRGTIYNTSILFSLPLLTEKEFDAIETPLIIGFSNYVSVWKQSNLWGININESFILNHMNMHTETGHYYQFRGNLLEFESVYNEVLEEYNKLNSKFSI